MLSKNNKKMTKTVLTSAIMATALTPAMASAQSVSFSDIDNAWAKGAIQELANSGIIGGYPDGTFKPEKEMTRLEFASLLAKALEKSGKLPKAEGETKFKDVPDWAKGSIHDLSSAGIIFGYSETKFGSNDPITRQQIAVMLVRTLGYETEAATMDLELPFNDSDTIHDNYKGAVAFASKLGLIQGDNKGNFNPTKKTTRQEAASFIHRLYTGNKSKSGDFFEDAKKLVLEHKELTLDNKGLIHVNDLNAYIITGSGKPGTKVKVVVTDKSNGHVTAQEEVDENGKFKSILNLSELEDGELTIKGTVLDEEGKDTEKVVTVTVVKDTKAPDSVSANPEETTITNLTDQNNFKVTGVTEPGAKVKVELVQGDVTLTKETVANKIDGKYELFFDTNKFLAEAITVNATATDEAGNSTSATPVTITKSGSAFITPQIAKVEHVNANSDETKVPVTVYAQAGKTVILEVTGKKALGEVKASSTEDDVLTKTIKVTTESNGKKDVEIDLSEFDEGEVSVTLIDGDKRSEVATIIKDLEAPESPEITTKGYINKKSEKEYVVEGTTEPGNEVEIVLVDENNKEVKSEKVTADKDGKFSAKVNTEELAEGVVKIKATSKDKAGNVSDVLADDKLPTVTKDVTAPAITEVTGSGDITPETKQDEYKVEGKTEKGATVVVEILNKADENEEVIKVVSQPVVADDEGKFTATLNTTILQDGELTIKVTTTDKAGNTTTHDSTKVVKNVDKDEIVLNKGLEKTVTLENVKKFKVAGTADGNANVIIQVFKGNVFLNGYQYTTQANANGEFLEEIDLQELTKGKYNIRVFQENDEENVEKLEIDKVIFAPGEALVEINRLHPEKTKEIKIEYLHEAGVTNAKKENLTKYHKALNVIEEELTLEKLEEVVTDVNAKEEALGKILTLKKEDKLDELTIQNLVDAGVTNALERNLEQYKTQLKEVEVIDDVEGLQLFIDALNFDEAKKLLKNLVETDYTKASWATFEALELDKLPEDTVEDRNDKANKIYEAVEDLVKQGDGEQYLQLLESIKMDDLIFKVSKVSGNDNGKPEHKFTHSELATAFKKATDKDLENIARVILGENATSEQITAKVDDLRKITFVTTGIKVDENGLLSVENGILSAEHFNILKNADDETPYNISVYYKYNSGGPASENRLAQITIERDGTVKFAGVNPAAIEKVDPATPTE